MSAATIASRWVVLAGFLWGIDLRSLENPATTAHLEQGLVHSECGLGLHSPLSSSLEDRHLQVRQPGCRMTKCQSKRYTLCPRLWQVQEPSRRLCRPCSFSYPLSSEVCTSSRSLSVWLRQRCSQEYCRSWGHDGLCLRCGDGRCLKGSSLKYIWLRFLSMFCGSVR